MQSVEPRNKLLFGHHLDLMIVSTKYVWPVMIESQKVKNEKPVKLKVNLEQ